MGWVAAGVIVSALAAGYGVYSGEQSKAVASKGRKRQAQAQQEAIGRQTATAARSRGREEQARRGRQLAIANAARIGVSPGAGGTPIESTNPIGSLGGARTLG